ncbi:sulfate transport system permease protein CysW [Klebsiella pneumoniae]|uniref:Sulfate transport system permease protein CysW n=1 Tax=Klebsiella pneumoniae TaxID=573 RepID=A0A2X3F556_KLEPN|nr:sulfate transport system permease protein CysW [Klebsiella pneumoniae]
MSVVSGSIRGETLSLPLQIELLEQDYKHRRLVYRRRPADVNGYSDPVFKEYVAMAVWPIRKKRAQQEGNHEH